MPIELNNADLAEIERIWSDLAPESTCEERIYRAGIAAGLERAAKEAENVTARWPLYNAAREECAKDCAAAIRALIK